MTKLYKMTCIICGKKFRCARNCEKKITECWCLNCTKKQFGYNINCGIKDYCEWRIA